VRSRRTRAECPSIIQGKRGHESELRGLMLTPLRPPSCHHHHHPPAWRRRRLPPPCCTRLPTTRTCPGTAPPPPAPPRTMRMATGPPPRRPHHPAPACTTVPVRQKSEKKHQPATPAVVRRLVLLGWLSAQRGNCSLPTVIVGMYHRVQRACGLQPIASPVSPLTELPVSLF
jgi:hypothetical protein